MKKRDFNKIKKYEEQKRNQAFNYLSSVLEKDIDENMKGAIKVIIQSVYIEMEMMRETEEYKKARNQLESAYEKMENKPYV